MSTDEQQPETYGEITCVGDKPGEHKKLKILDFYQCEFKDHRLISVLGIEDETIVVGVENPPSSGRAISQTMRLSMESFVGIVSSMLFYLRAKGYTEDKFTKLIEEAVAKGEMHYSFSPNLEDLATAIENDKQNTNEQ